MKLSVVIPFFDDRHEADSMVRAVQQSLSQPIEMEFLLMDLHEEPSLPAIKNRASNQAGGEFVLFLFPGIFPLSGSIEKLLARLEEDPALAAVAGRWCNARGKLEVGYNVRRFPTVTALILDILLLNKLFPRNRVTRAYKMHDFDHNRAVYVQHANDCVLMLRRSAILRHTFNESYAPGWFDQVEFCKSLSEADARILFEPGAEFVSNERVPLISRMVEQQYAEYRRAEFLYVRNHFGILPAAIARAALVIGMLVRMGFSIVLPATARRSLLSTLRSYVDDDYVRNLRGAYWRVFKNSLRGHL